MLSQAIAWSRAGQGSASIPWDLGGGSVGFRGSLLWVPLSEGSLGVRLVHQHKGGGGVNSPSAESGAGGRDEEIMSLCGGTPARPVNPISGFPLYLLLYGIICSQQERGLPPWCLLLMGLELASDWGGRLMLRGWRAAAPAAGGGLGCAVLQPGSDRFPPSLSRSVPAEIPATCAAGDVLNEGC